MDQIIDLSHPMVWLACHIYWAFIEARLGEVYSPGAGQPPLPIRLMAGLLIVKHMQSLSDEALCARFLDSPYVQFFCGGQVFRHDLPFRSLVADALMLATVTSRDVTSSALCVNRACCGPLTDGKATQTVRITRATSVWETA